MAVSYTGANWAGQYASQLAQMQSTPGQIYYTTSTFSPVSEPPKRRKTMLENVKGYIEKHKDVIFTLGLVILVDHFLFKGALRERIKKTVEGVLSKAENLIDQKKGE